MGTVRIIGIKSVIELLWLLGLLRQIGRVAARVSRVSWVVRYWYVRLIRVISVKRIISVIRIKYVISHKNIRALKLLRPFKFKLSELFQLFWVISVKLLG